MAGSAGDNEPHHFTFVPAPADLSSYVNSLYVWRSEPGDLNDSLPAYSAQMASFAEGEARMAFDDGAIGETSDAFFLAPLCQARQFHVRGPAVLFGVSINFRGWAALSGLSVHDHHDQFLSSELVLGDSLAEEFAALAPKWRKGKLSEDEYLDAMADIVRRGITALSAQHLQVIDRTLEWLSSSFRPELDDLYSTLPYSKRQVQRLVAQFFGQSPVRLVRRYRAVRAATLLSLPALSDEIEADIHAAFYDQAHLIKELRFFTGRTPKRLLPDGPSPVHDMLGADGYGAVDLFGSGEAKQLGRDEH